MGITEGLTSLIQLLVLWHLGINPAFIDYLSLDQLDA